MSSQFLDTTPGSESCPGFSRIWFRPAKPRTERALCMAPARSILVDNWDRVFIQRDDTVLYTDRQSISKAAVLRERVTPPTPFLGPLSGCRPLSPRMLSCDFDICSPVLLLSAEPENPRMVAFSSRLRPG